MLARGRTWQWSVEAAAWVVTVAKAATTAMAAGVVEVLQPGQLVVETTLWAWTARLWSLLVHPSRLAALLACFLLLDPAWSMTALALAVTFAAAAAAAAAAVVVVVVALVVVVVAVAVAAVAAALPARS